MTIDNATSRWSEQPDGSFVPERIYTYRDTPRDNGGWVLPTLGAGVTDYSTPWGGIRVRKDAAGYVHFKGMGAANIIAGATICTVPVGYRPGVQVLLPVWMNDGTEHSARVDIKTDGTVLCAIAITNWVSLNGIHYFAEG